MPRLTVDQWADVRAEREAGVSFGDLAKKYGVSGAAICKRAKKEEWGDGSDVSEEIRRRVNEKVNAVNTADPKKKIAAISAAADKIVKIVARHRDDWETHHATFDVPAIAKDFNLGKSAKISAEMLAIRQKAERVAWGLEDNESKPEIKIQWTGLGDRAQSHD